MYRRFFLSIFFLAFLTSFYAGAQMLYPISDAKMAQLRGPVKSVATYMVEKKMYFTQDELKAYKAKGEKLPEYERSLLTIDNFNPEGNYTECIDTVFRMRKAYMYFKPESGLGGKVLSIKTYIEGKFDTYYSFDYDRETKRPKHAKKIKWGLNPATMQNDVIFEEWSEYETKGDTIIQFHSQEYPDGRYVGTRITYLASDSTILRMSVMRDNVWQEQTFFTRPNDLHTVTTMQYTNSDFDLISAMADDNERIVYKKYPDGSFESIKKILYNSHGDPVSESTVTETTTTDYTYDSHGNWTRRVIHSPQGDRITEREITYYE